MTGRRRDVVVVGAGHNGLVAACYLAAAGLDVEVVERDTVAGGAVSTVERWPGVRVDRGSSVHVMVRHTDIAAELRLADLGLVYDDVEPWGTVPVEGGMLRLSADLESTCTSIAAVCGPADAAAYREYVAAWAPRMQLLLDTAAGPPTTGRITRATARLIREQPQPPARLARTFLEPAEAALARTFSDDRLRAALGWWAAQSGPPPHEAGTAPMAGTVALLHRRRAGRPRGGSGRLSEALVERLAAYGGTLRLGDTAVRISPDSHGAVVRTASGDVIAARAVVAACPTTVTAGLLGDRAAAAQIRSGTGMGMALRLLSTDLPRYPDAVADTHTSMQLLVRSTQQLRAAYGDLLRGDPAADPPLVVMTPTATDSSLAPAGRHVVTVWAQWHPRVLARGDWVSRRDAVADGILDTLEGWAPGFASSVLDGVVQTPADLESELGLPDGNVMHVDPTLDALFGLRPIPGWGTHRSPYRRVFLCGASTHPGGGVWGASGRSVARLVARDLRRAHRRYRLL